MIVALTDLERGSEYARSTVNLFDLPVFCQYGVGEGFPLMYHWRVLPDSTPLPEELADIERAVAYWGGGSQVRRRIQAACAMVERELAAGISFMNSRGLLHFDAHFENILTDGQRLYFADYGLAISSGFELWQDDVDFFDRHQTYDRCYTATYLVYWLVTALHQGEDRYSLVRAYAKGARPAGIPEEAAAILARHAPIAAVMSDFNHKFQHQSRQTRYPLEEIRHLGKPADIQKDSYANLDPVSGSRTDVSHAASRVARSITWMKGRVMTYSADGPQPSSSQDLPAGELVRQLSEQVSTLVREELRLAQMEMGQKGKQAGVGIGMLGSSGVVALFGAGCLIACAVLAISGVLPAWLAALLVGAVLSAVAGGAALVGKAHLKRAAPPVPKDTAASVKADVEVLKEGAQR